MTFGLRYLHVHYGLSAGVVFAVVFGLYILTTGSLVINGYTRELFGTNLYHIGRIHKVIYHFHTGMHIGTRHSYGDEINLRRTARSTSHATPGGAVVYYSPWRRWHRALRNNLFMIAFLSNICGMVLAPDVTVVVDTLAFIAGLASLIIFWVYRIRARVAARRPVTRPSITMPLWSRTVLKTAPVTGNNQPALAGDTRPRLEGAPQSILATLLAGEMSCSAAEILARLQMSTEQSQLTLPDTFPALSKQKERIDEIIQSHTKGKIGISWDLTGVPRTVSWIPVIEHKLPNMVRFRDYLDKIEVLGPREFGVGVNDRRDMYVTSHNGDLPWHCRFAGMGTGKSTGFLVKTAQVAHKDPAAQIYCIDTKQVSFRHVKGIPGIHVFDNPQSEMNKIWEVFYSIAGIMDDRYTAIREGRAKFEDYDDIWVFVDEGNDLGAQLKSYNRNVLEGTTANPPIWGECIARILRMGREARIFGEWMFQDLMDRAMGGESLKMAFSEFGAAGFLPGQFTRTIGPPAPECLEGPGKILMCRSNRREWVQGFYDDENWLHDYALENRRKLAA